MSQQKLLLPKQADERSRIAIGKDLDPAEACYAEGDRLVLIARERFCARIESAQWERYLRYVASVTPPLVVLSYPEWLIKKHRLEDTYAAWSREQAWYHFGGLVNEAYANRYRRRGERRLQGGWFVPSIERRINRRQPQGFYEVKVALITLNPKTFIDPVPTLEYTSRPLMVGTGLSA